MYVQITTDASGHESTYGSRNPYDDLYLVGEVAQVDRWAIRRISASYARFAWENTGLSVMIIAIHALLWILLGITVGSAAAFWYGTTMTPLLLVTVAIAAIVRGVYAVSLLYTWAATGWLRARGVMDRTYPVRDSLILSMIHAQVSGKSLNAPVSRYYPDAARWLENNASFNAIFDRLLSDQWLKDAEKSFGGRPDTADKVTNEKFALLETKIRERVWSFSQEIIAAQEASEDAARKQQRLQVNNLLETVDELTAKAPANPTAQWEQPSTRPAKADKSMR